MNRPERSEWVLSASALVVDLRKSAEPLNYGRKADDRVCHHPTVIGHSREFRVPVVLWGVASLQVMMALIASVADWPAQLSTDRTSPADTLEWLVKGSAVSAPLVFVVAMLVTGAMATRRGVLGMVGDGLAIAIAVILAVASLGETFAEGPVTAPRAVLIGSGVLGVCWQY